MWGGLEGLLMKAIIRWTFLLINFFCILCALIAFWGSSVSPEKFLLPAYFVLVLPIILFFNVAFVVLWAIFRKWYFVFSLALLLLSYPKTRAVFPLNFKSNTKEVVEGSFSIMTYNTAAFGRMKVHTKESPNPIIQYILDNAPDIVCIQEFVVSRYQTEQDIARIFKNYPYRHVHFQGNRHWGIATFSKFPIINRGVVDIPSRVNSAMFSDIVIGADTVRVFNMHLESNRLTESDKAMPLELRRNFDMESLANVTRHLSQKLGVAYRIRAQQADILAEYIKNSPHSVIVAGDMNDVPLSYSYTTIRGDMNDVFVSLGRGFGITFYENLYKFRIDYIFSDQNFVPLYFRRDRVKYSDHYPLTAILKKASP